MLRQVDQEGEIDLQSRKDSYFEEGADLIKNSRKNSISKMMS